MQNVDIGKYVCGSVDNIEKWLSREYKSGKNE